MHWHAMAPHLLDRACAPIPGAWHRARCPWQARQSESSASAPAGELPNDQQNTGNSPSGREGACANEAWIKILKPEVHDQVKNGDGR